MKAAIYARISTMGKGQDVDLKLRESLRSISIMGYRAVKISILHKRKNHDFNQTVCQR